MAGSTSVRSVRLFRNGRSQAIRIPQEFALPGAEATIWRDSRGRLIVEAVKKPSVLELLDRWGPLRDADALTLKAVLVTDNVRKFARVQGLRVENWTRL